VKATKDGHPVPLEREVLTIDKGDRQVVRVKLEASPPGLIVGKVPPPSAITPFDAATAKEHQMAWAKHLGVPAEFTNSLGMKFRLIPPGEFEMGSTPKDIEAARAAEKYSDDQAVSDALTSEGPIHRVVLSEPFYLGVTEVTQKDFETVTGENPSSFRSGGGNAEKVSDTDTSQLPVQGTSWNDAANFCSRLSVREGLISNYQPVGTAVRMLPGNGYRLPREAQWEFACRAGTTTRFWFGNDPADHANREWFQANSAGRPQRVGSLAKNPFGLFDMHGNVSEWVQDGWNPEFYLLSKDRPAVDPLAKPKGSHQHMVRGGAWTSKPAVRGRSAFRMPAVPSQRYESNGFRVVLTVDSARQVINRPAHGKFVVLTGKGIEVRKFETLADAVQSASDGDTIEVRGNGPFVSEPVSILGSALTIRAGEGYRPVIKLSPEGVQRELPLLSTNAALVLESLELHRARPDAQSSGRGHTVVHTHLGPLWAANCQFRGPIWSNNSPVCVFRNCEFVAAPVAGLHRPGGRVMFENCLVRTTGQAIGILYDDTTLDNVSIQFKRSTIVSNWPSFLLQLHTPLPDPAKQPNTSKPFRLEVTECVLDAKRALGFHQNPDFLTKGAALEPAAAETALQRLLEWRGERNVFAAGSTSVWWFADLKDQAPHGPKSLEEWKRFWGGAEVDSAEEQPRFQGGNLRAQLTTDSDQLTPKDFRLRADSPGYRAGKNDKDLGADVDLVGPGPAYERWKKTPEYQEWLKETQRKE
jgi:formylglycine-generating enzyme required for sulfatase activity